MQTLKYPTKTKAKKEHRCDFCGDKITIGETYLKSTHKMDDVYDWKTHSHCAKIASTLKMYDNADEGVNGEHFQESIHNEHDDLLIGLLPQDGIEKYGDIIRQLRFVRFKDKLSYVIRHYNKMEMQNEKIKKG